MAHAFRLSAFGLKMIKAYEGFRPVETAMITGQRVIGYGHKVREGDPSQLTKEEASSLLMDDLAPYEAMVNAQVHAPLSQSQFDALVSLAFNIGPKAFEESAVLRALNNGRPLDAAAAFDAWRKSTVHGQVYVIDALVRRRTAEKALFLRPNGDVIEANRVTLSPDFDGNAALKVSDDEAEVLDREMAQGIVDLAPYAAAPAQFRRKEDGPAGTLTLSEIAIAPDSNSGAETSMNEDVFTDDNPFLTDLDEDLIAPRGPSQIAIAAAEVSDQLDRLIDQNVSTAPNTANSNARSEDAVIEPTLTLDTAIELRNQGDAQTDTPVLNLTAANDIDLKAMPLVDKVNSQYTAPNAHERTGSSLPYWIMLAFGAGLLGYGGANAYLEKSRPISETATLLYPFALMIGAMILLGALFYLVKFMLNDRR